MSTTNGVNENIRTPTRCTFIISNLFLILPLSFEGSFEAIFNWRHCNATLFQERTIYINHFARQCNPMWPIFEKVAYFFALLSSRRATPSYC